MAQKFDALVIGTGQTGPALAARLDKEGLKVALVERGKLRGNAPFTGPKIMAVTKEPDRIFVSSGL